MKSAITKRSIKLNGVKTSVSLEDEFWDGLLTIAKSKKQTPTALLQTIDLARSTSNLSSAIRVFVLGHYRGLADQRSQAAERPYLPQPVADAALVG
jgi:predicted DNA-binding ribbon-helix-helix protein